MVGKIVRLFPNRAEIRFEWPVHEQVVTSLNRAGIPIQDTSIETDFRPVWKKTNDLSNHAGFSAIRAAFVEQVVGAVCRVFDQGPQGADACGREIFIRVQNKNPSALSCFHADIPRSTEIIAPLKMQNARAAVFGNGGSAIFRSRINNDELVCNVSGRLKASRNAGSFIFRDQNQ